MMENESDKNIARHTWNEEENDLLKRVIQKYGTNNWTLVAAEIRGRSAKQCHDRWNIINPNMKKGKWSEEEDHIILKSFEILGKQWTKVKLY